MVGLSRIRTRFKTALYPNCRVGRAVRVDFCAMNPPDAFTWVTLWHGAAVLAVMAGGAWLASLPLRDVSIVDRLWALLFVAAAVTYARDAAALGPRAVLTLALTTLWGLRLSLYITWRHRGHGEDR